MSENPYDSFSKKDVLEIRGSLKPQVESAGKTYDETEFKNAEPEVRVTLGAKWMNKLRQRLPKEKQGANELDFQKKVFGSLWISPDTPNDEKVDIIKHFQSTHGLDADGIIGPKTLEALDNASGDDGSFSTPIKMLDAEGQDTWEVYSKSAREATPPEAGAEEKTDKPKLTPAQKEARRAFKTAKDALTKAQNDQNETAAALKDAKKSIEPAQKDIDDKTLDFNEKESAEEMAKQTLDEKTEIAEQKNNSVIEAEQIVQDTTIAKRDALKAYNDVKDKDDISEQEKYRLSSEYEAADRAQKEAIANKRRAEAESAKAEFEKTQADQAYKLAQAETTEAKAALDKANQALEEIKTKVAELEKKIIDTALAEDDAEQAVKDAKAILNQEMQSWND